MLTKRWVLGATAVAAAMLLSGCGTMTDVKTVANDPDAHFNYAFAPEKMSPKVLAKVPHNQAPLGFRKLTIKMQASSEESDGKKDSWINLFTMEPFGNGELVKLKLDARTAVLLPGKGNSKSDERRTGRDARP